MVESSWQRADRERSTREHFLMALADLQAILIKASVTTNTIEARIKDVSLDVASERAPATNPIAYEVEQVQTTYCICCYPNQGSNIIFQINF